MVHHFIEAFYRTYNDEAKLSEARTRSRVETSRRGGRLGSQQTWEWIQRIIPR